MSNGGWVKLHRSIRDNPRYRDPDWLAVWIYFLTGANHKAGAALFDGKRVVLQPGQLITGRLAISEKTGVQECKVKRVLEVMKSDQQIDQQAGAKGSIFTVRNWHLYQSVDQQIDQEMTSNRPTNDQQVTTPGEWKEGKNGEKGEARSMTAPAPMPSTARPLSQGNVANAPTWEEFFGYVLKFNDNVPVLFVEDKWLAGQQKGWDKIGNWQAYAERVYGWWVMDGKPTAKLKQGSSEMTDAEKLCEAMR